MLNRLMITFTPEERKALDQIACSEMRPAKEQVRYILRREFERLGLLQSTPTKQESRCERQPA